MLSFKSIAPPRFEMSINWILLHIIGTIVTFDSQLNGKRWCHSKSIAPPRIEEVNHLDPFLSNCHSCFLWFSIEWKDNVIPDQMILQLRKLFNWIILHVVIDTIVTPISSMFLCFNGFCIPLRSTTLFLCLY